MSCRVCSYAYNLVRWLDQGANALLGGDPRQTLSGRLGRAELAGVRWAARLCVVISFVLRDPKHCVGSVRSGDGHWELLDIDGPNDTFPDLADRWDRYDLKALNDNPRDLADSIAIAQAATIKDRPHAE